MILNPLLGKIQESPKSILGTATRLAACPFPYLSWMDLTLSKVLYHSIFLLGKKKKNHFTAKGQLKGINYGSTGSTENNGMFSF